MMFSFREATLKYIFLKRYSRLNSFLKKERKGSLHIFIYVMQMNCNLYVFMSISQYHQISWLKTLKLIEVFQCKINEILQSMQNISRLIKNSRVFEKKFYEGFVLEFCFFIGSFLARQIYLFTVLFVGKIFQVPSFSGPRVSHAYFPLIFGIVIQLKSFTR